MFKNIFLLYKTLDNKVSIDVQIDGETVWLTQDQMTELFGKSKKSISEHIVNIFKERELDEESVVRKNRITANNEKNYDV